MDRPGAEGVLLGALTLLLACVAHAGAPWLEAPLTEGVWVHGHTPSALLLSDRGTVLALGLGAALVRGPAGTFLVRADAGVARLLPPADGAWIGLGAADAAYALVRGHLHRDGRDTGIVADRVDVVPGRIVAAAGTRVTVYAEPSLKRLTRVDAPAGAAIFATTDGVAVVDLGEAVSVFRSGAWSRVPRPPGTLSRVGAQVRVAAQKGPVALDTAGTGWSPVGESAGAAWADALRPAGEGPPRSFGTTPLLDAREPPAPEPLPPPPPPGTRVARKQLLLQMIGTSGTTSGQDVVADILGDDHVGDDIVVEVPTAGADGRTDLVVLADGVHDGRAWARLPHALLLDRAEGRAALVGLPADCDLVGVLVVRGLALARCAAPAGEELHGWTGSSWAREAAVAPLGRAPRAHLAADGTLVLRPGDDAPDVHAGYLRAPDAVGAAAWVALPAADTWVPVPGGRAIAASTAGGTLTLRVVGPSGAASAPVFARPVVPGRYHVEPEVDAVTVWGTGWDLYDGLARVTVPLPPP